MKRPILLTTMDDKTLILDMDDIIAVEEDDDDVESNSVVTYRVGGSMKVVSINVKNPIESLYSDLFRSEK